MADSTVLWAGEASRYDRTRPSAPPVIADILTQLIHTPRPALVVDLGCGTGRSTLMWAERAERVIGIDPSEDMLGEAIRRLATTPHATNIAYQAAFARQTGLAAGSVDVVTCSQAFHWMEPSSTLAEVARILRPGGIFAVYDYSWPPTIRWELDQVFREVDGRYASQVEARTGGTQMPYYGKEHHLERMAESGHFRHTSEIQLHHREEGDAARFIGLVLSAGYSFQFKQGVVTEEEIGLERLRQAAFNYIGPEPVPWYFSYRVRLGIK
jgi:ubiquinone/menaquinone biosynthesis C-methylase UbiE